MSESVIKAKLKAFGSHAHPRHVVELDLDGDKVQIEIRAPSMLEKREIAMAAGATEENRDAIDASLLGVHLLIRCAYEPHGGAVFAKDDVAEILALGPVLDPVYKVALGMFNAPDDPAGKSEPIPS